MGVDDTSEGGFLWEGGLVGPGAVDWLWNRRTVAGHLLDAGLSAMTQVFDSNRLVDAFVPAPARFQPRDFFLAVDGDIADDKAWLEIVRANELFERSIAQLSNANDPRVTFEVSTFQMVMWEEKLDPFPLGQALEYWSGF